MSSFCIASLLSPTPKSNPSRPSSSQKLSPTSKSAIDINMPVLGAAPLLSAADLLQMASASMMSPYNQPNLASVFNPAALSHPTAYPFAQLPPFFGKFFFRILTTVCHTLFFARLSCFQLIFGASQSTTALIHPCLIRDKVRAV